jgi:Tfp pilus assembly protein PilV
MIQNKLSSQRHLKSRMSGIALIEAMLALGVVMAAVVGILWFNATILGSSAGSRVNSAGMLAAQAKLEELRNTPFATIAAGNDIVVFESPGFVGQASISVNRCWSVAALQHSGASVPDIVRVVVSAVGGGGTCDTTDATAPVRLISLLAKSDPRLAAQNSIANSPADGKGKLVSSYTPPQTATSAPSPTGFNVITNDGVVVAVTSPSGGPALVSDDGSSLKFATISGNIMFDGARTVAEFAKLLVRIEGNAMCRVYFPAYNPATPSATAPPTITGGGATLGYVQYSCVVGDGWRRSIVVLTGNADEKVCVGYPAMQPTDETADLLESPGRQYVGRKAGAQAGEWVWEGVRGASDGTSAIGSVCSSADSTGCWANDNTNGTRGWVPGGHHYFVMPKSAGLCADRIETVGTAIDTASAGQTSVAPSLYTNYFFRNPHKVYCTNDKAYTNTLPAIPTNEEFTTSDCYSYTKVSGFINQDTGIVVNGNQIVFGSNSTYYAPCRSMGAYGNFGGGYVCGFPESVTTSLTPFLSGYTFNPGSYSGLAPLAVPLDFVRKSFTLGSSGGTCASETKTWTVGATTCQGTIASTNSGQSAVVSSTATGSYGNGSATYACSGSAWSGTPTSVTCTTEVVTPPFTCASVSVTGSRKNDVPMTFTGGSCTYASKSTYSCSSLNVAGGSTLTLHHQGNGANDKTVSIAISQSSACTNYSGGTYNF